MITVQEFILRRDENTAEYLKQVKNNSFDLKRFHGIDCEAGKISRSVLSRKGNDILDSVIHGMLPVLTKYSGADAYMLEDCNIIPVELKSSYTDESKFFKTAKNAVYSVTLDKIKDGCVERSSTTSFKSNFNASFEIKKNLNIQCLNMYFTVRDSRDDRVIEVIKVAGKDLYEYLFNRKIPKSRNVTIKLSKCEQLGVRVKSPIADIVGLDAWKEELLKTLPMIKIISTKKQNSKNNSLPYADFPDLSKNDPSGQTSNPCTEYSVRL